MQRISKWIYPAHIENDLEKRMIKEKSKTLKCYNQIVNEALEMYFKIHS